MSSSTHDLNALKRLVDEAVADERALKTAKRNEQESKNALAVLHTQRARLDAEILASEKAIERARAESRRLQAKVEVSEYPCICSPTVEGML